MSISPSGATGNVLPKGYKTGQLQQFTPEQMALLKQSFAFTDPNGQLYKQAMGDESAFAPIEQRAMRDFQTFQGNWGSRFAGLGTGGAHSSGFRNLQTQGAQDFASSLAEQRNTLKRQALYDLMGISSTLLGQRPYEQFLIPKQKKPSIWEKILGIGLPAAGAIAGGFIPGGGPAGAALGAQLGSTLASGFTGGQPGNYEGISSLPTSWKSFGKNENEGTWDNLYDLARY
jgi:hypothetical protein